MEIAMKMGIPLGSNSPKIPVLNAYTGQFANRCVMPTQILAAGVATKIITKTKHYARTSVSSFKIAYPNWYVNTVSFAEGGNGGTATITSAIEYPIGVTLTQVTWSAIPSVDVPSGTQSALSDTINVAIPEGEAFIVRTYVTNASGVVVDAGGNSANGEEFRYTTGALTDQTMTMGTYSGGSSSSLSFAPILLVATITRPSILLIGDSRCFGYSDSYAGSSSGDIGETARCVGPYFGYVSCGTTSSTTLGFVNSHTLQVALGAYCSHIICELGINDLKGVISPATSAGRITTIAGYFSPKKVYQTTLPPITSSTDNWATLGNQTQDTANGDRVTFNGLVRAGISGITNYFELADVAETARNSGYWITNGVANYYVSDGIHEKQNMNILYMSRGAISPYIFT